MSCIYEEPDWYWEAHCGWGVAHEGPDAKVWTRKSLMFSRSLVLFRGGGDPGEALARVPRQGLVHFKFLAPGPAGAPSPAFHPCGGARYFHEATCVMDLRKPEEERWQEVGNKTRNMVRKAREAGLRVELGDSWSPAELARYFALYAHIQRKTGLAAPSEDQLKEMRSRGHVLLAAVRSGDEIVHMAVVYLTQRMGYFLSGAAADSVPNGSGQLLHWEVSSCLVRLGKEHYDLGGLPLEPEKIGIVRFKTSLAPQRVDYGPEFSREPLLLAQLRRFRAQAKFVLGGAAAARK